MPSSIRWPSSSVRFTVLGLTASGRPSAIRSTASRSRYAGSSGSSSKPPGSLNLRTDGRATSMIEALSADGTFYRRDLLKLAALPLIPVSLGAAGGVAGDSVARYLESLRGDDGRYAWEEGSRPHLTPTFAAVGCYHLLGRRPPAAEAVA